MKIQWMLVYAVINLVSFLVCAWDKKSAQRGGRRVPEKTLWTLSACFGALGMWLGMKAMRHKTHKPGFVIGVPLLFIAQIFAMMFLGVFAG
jgi:uncharacterized membrane protein YsdA (DUF1294 family)